MGGHALHSLGSVLIPETNIPPHTSFVSLPLVLVSFGGSLLTSSKQLRSLTGLTLGWGQKGGGLSEGGHRHSAVPREQVLDTASGLRPQTSWVPRARGRPPRWLCSGALVP